MSYHIHIQTLSNEKEEIDKVLAADPSGLPQRNIVLNVVEWCPLTVCLDCEIPICRVVYIECESTINAQIPNYDSLYKEEQHDRVHSTRLCSLSAISSDSRSCLLSSNLGLAIFNLCLCSSFLCFLLRILTSFHIILVIWMFISTSACTDVGSAKHYVVFFFWTSSADRAIVLVSKAVLEVCVWCFSLHATVTRHRLHTRTVVSLGGTSGRHDEFLVMLEGGRFGV